MTISLNVLKDLGIGLYSNVPAVLSEMVANAWDAEATNVEIKINAAKDTVEVFDNGIGMDLDDINSRFLRVGYDRRKECGDESGSLHRKVMGRKGIGKLSAFSIASQVDVITAKGNDQHALRMSRDEIRRAVERENPAESGEYIPKDIRGEVSFDFPRGTRLILGGFDARLNWTEAYLRRRIARRFSIIGTGFQVTINGKRIAVTDRDFYSRLQFLWYAGKEGDAARHACKNLDHSEPAKWPISAAGVELGVVTGWIGTVRKPDDVGEENNTITVLAKGKIVQEDILKDIKEARVFAEYLIGELHAEFLDDERDDIVTSDRQRLKETDPRYEALRDFVKEVVKAVGNRWDELRVRDSEKQALELPAVMEWYKRLKDVQRDAAKKMFGRIESLKLPNEDARRELYRASILAFERLEYRNVLDGISALTSPNDDQLVADIFERIDALEGAHYCQIIAGRLAILKKLAAVGPPRWRQSIVQKYLFAHPWMLDPSLERASENTNIQAKLERARGKVAGRHELHYLRSARGHLLVDLRSHAEAPPLEDLEREATATIADARTILRGHDAGDPELQDEPVTLVVLVAATPPPRRRGRGAIAVGEEQAQYITYDDMLEQTSKAYSTFLERQTRSSELMEIMERFERDLEKQRPSMAASRK